MSYSNFNTFKLFQNVGINSSSNYVLSMESTGNNVSFHSSNSIDYNNVDIMSIKNIINKKQNEDLNLSSLNGNTINPVITINNNHSDCRIMTNLNVSGNLNITQNLNIESNLKIKNLFPASLTTQELTLTRTMASGTHDCCVSQVTMNYGIRSPRMLCVSGNNELWLPEPTNAVFLRLQ